MIFILHGVNHVSLSSQKHPDYINFRSFKMGSILSMCHKMHVSQRVRWEWREAHGKCFSKFRREPLRRQAYLCKCVSPRPARKCERLLDSGRGLGSRVRICECVRWMRPLAGCSPLHQAPLGTLGPGYQGRQPQRGHGCNSCNRHLLAGNRAPWWRRWWRICLRCRRPGLHPRVGRTPWRRKWQPTPAFLPGESRGRRSLMGRSSWGLKELDTTERLTLSQREAEGDHRAEVAEARTCRALECGGGWLQERWPMNL